MRPSAHSGLLAARNRVVAIDYNTDWPFALEGRADFGPFAALAGVNGTTGTVWNSSGQLVAATQYEKRITYDPVTLACRGLVVEAQARTDLAATLALNAPVTTASITVTAGPHIISFTGSGSITLSGAASGTISGTGADRHTAQLVTTSSGSLTITPSGQVRNLDVIATSAGLTSHGQPIVGGSARATESYQVSGTGFTNCWPGSTGYIYFEWWDKSFSENAGCDLFGSILNNGVSESLIAYQNIGAGGGGVNYWIRSSSGTYVVTTPNLINFRAKNKVVLYWSPANGCGVCLNGVAGSTFAYPPAFPNPNQFRMGNTMVSGSGCMADVSRVTFKTTAINMATAQALTAP